MNLAIINNIITNETKCIIVHNYKNGDIGYSTYDEKLSDILDIILNNKIGIKKTISNYTYYSDCNIFNSGYLNSLNNYLPYQYKIIWIKKMDNSDNINEILQEAYKLL